MIERFVADGHAHDVGEIRVNWQAAFRAHQSLIFHRTGIGTSGRSLENPPCPFREVR